MPWYLAPHRPVRQVGSRYLVEERIEWRLAPSEPRPFGLTSADCPPKEEDLRTTFSLLVEDGRDAIPDFARGPAENTVVVSRAFRELVEAMDPAPHYYIPLRIVLAGGRVLEGTHFLFKLGSFVDDGIVVEQSDVAPHPRGGTFRRYLTRNMTPNLMWKASKVAGRHIWADRYLPHEIVVSDELYAEMKRRNMLTFVTKESRIDQSL